MAHIVMCRLCKKRFNTDLEEAVLEGQKAYYHKSCYEIWKKNLDNPQGDMEADFWYEALVDYLYRDVKMSINFPKLQNQWSNFTKPGRNMTPKGIFFAMKYFYDVQKGEVEKAMGGIGIVPNIYARSAEYWANREMQKAGTLDAIIAEIKARDTRPVQTIVQKKNTKKDKSKWSLDDI